MALLAPCCRQDKYGPHILAALGPANLPASRPADPRPGCCVPRPWCPLCFSPTPTLGCAQLISYPHSPPVLAQVASWAWPVLLPLGALACPSSGIYCVPGIPVRSPRSLTGPGQVVPPPPLSNTEASVVPEPIYEHWGTIPGSRECCRVTLPPPEPMILPSL